MIAFWQLFKFYWQIQQFIYDYETTKQSMDSFTIPFFIVYISTEKYIEMTITMLNYRHKFINLIFKNFFILWVNSDSVEEKSWVNLIIIITIKCLG